MTACQVRQFPETRADLTAAWTPARTAPAGIQPGKGGAISAATGGANLSGLRSPTVSLANEAGFMCPTSQCTRLSKHVNVQFQMLKSPEGFQVE